MKYFFFTIIVVFSNISAAENNDDYLNYAIPKTAVFREVPFRPTNECNKQVRAFVGDQVVAITTYFRGGGVFDKYLYKDGKIHGVSRCFHKNGNVKFEMPYDNGIRHGVFKQFKEDGALLGSFEMNRGVGIAKIWDEQGVLIEECSYVNNEQEGLTKEYYPSGQIRTISKYKSGKLHGFSVSFYKSGKKAGLAYFKNGELHGVINKWAEGGNIKAESPAYWINGEQVTLEMYLELINNDPIVCDVKEAEKVLESNEKR